MSRRRGFGFDEKGLHGGIFGGLAAPGYGHAGAPQPEGQKVSVARRQGVARLSTGNGEQGDVPVARSRTIRREGTTQGRARGSSRKAPAWATVLASPGAGKGAQVEGTLLGAGVPGDGPNTPRCGRDPTASFRKAGTPGQQWPGTPSEARRQSQPARRRGTSPREGT